MVVVRGRGVCQKRKLSTPSPTTMAGKLIEELNLHSLSRLDSTELGGTDPDVLLEYFSRIVTHCVDHGFDRRAFAKRLKDQGTPLQGTNWLRLAATVASNDFDYLANDHCQIAPSAPTNLSSSPKSWDESVKDWPNLGERLISVRPVAGSAFQQYEFEMGKPNDVFGTHLIKSMFPFRLLNPLK
jgi:hypothetical protein